MNAKALRLFEAYALHQELLGYSATVLRRELGELRRLAVWATAQACCHLLTLSPATAKAYAIYLAHLPNRRGQRLLAATVHYKLCRIKRFYRWLLRKDHIADNPFAHVQLPKLVRQYTRQPLTEAELGRLLAVPDVATANGFRVRAVLETFYSTGLREMELARLRLYDLDTARGLLLVREGKFRKSRVVPIGERALAWIMRYLAEVRPLMISPPDDGFLFLSCKGRGYRCQGNLSYLVRRTFEKAGIEKPGACHILRHTAAAHMLRGGADIRYIQAMLGHANLRTTERYTQLECSGLKAVLQRCHPLEQAGCALG